MERRAKSVFICSLLWVFIAAAALLFIVRSVPAFLTTVCGISGFDIKTAVISQVLKNYVPDIYYGILYDDENTQTFSFADICTIQWEPLYGYVTLKPVLDLAMESQISDAILVSSDAVSDTDSSIASDESSDTSSAGADDDSPENSAGNDSDSLDVSAASTDNNSSEGSAADTDSNNPGGSAADTNDDTLETSAAGTGGDIPEGSATETVSETDSDSDTNPSSDAMTEAVSETIYTAAQLSDFSFLLNNFYTLDSTTTIDETLLDGQTLLSEDFTLTGDNSSPQILIYHTHSQEDFADSIAGDSSTTIVGVGEYLATVLTETYGYNVIHNCDTYDLVDGELDRNKAYSEALKGVSAILEEYPSIEVVIDLHRDGIDGEKMTTMINGKETARFMFFNGLSRTAKNGEISYLYNPYIQDNLAFSLQLQLKAAAYYPDVIRPIYLKGYRYNLHLRPRSLLIEVGSQKNTYQEAQNAMDVLADLLNKVLKGSS